MKHFLSVWNKVKRNVLMAVSFFALGSTAMGATFYVSTTGSDANSGTSAGAAFLTIPYAVTQASAGDVIVIASGSYANQTVFMPKSLTFDIDGQTITVRSLRMTTSGVTLTIKGTSTLGEMFIKDSLQLTGGIVKISGATKPNLKVMNGAKLLGGSKTSYVDGGYWIGSTIATAITWHVGVGADYRPVKVTTFSKATGSTEYYFAQVFSGAPSFTASLPANTRNISKMHYWQLSTTAISTESGAFVTQFQYDSVSNDDYVYDYLNLQLLTCPGSGSWTLNNTAGSADRLGTINGTSVTMATQSLYFVLGNKIGTATTLGGTNTLGNTEPFAAFTTQNKCEGDTIIFTSTSKSTGSLISTYTWDFGDGSSPVTTSVPWVKYVYQRQTPTPSQYNYTASLTISNGNSTGSNSDIGYKTIIIYNTPRVPLNSGIYTQIAFVTPTKQSVCDGQLTRITDTYSPPSGETFVQKIWTITPPVPAWTRGGTPATIGYKDSSRIHYRFPAAGSYKIYIQRKTNNGCVAKDSIEYIQHAKPSVTINMVDQCWGLGKNVVITNGTPEPTPDKMLKWTWDFGDGTAKLNGTATPLVAKTVFHSFPTAGVYPIKLVVTSDADCKDSQTTNLTLFQKPVAAYTLTPTCEGDTTRTLNTSSVSGSETIQFTIWKWGDFTVPDSAFPNSQHLYLKPGLYKVILEVQTYNLCTDTQAVWHRIHPIPHPKYQVKEVCFGDTTRFRRVIDKYPRKDSMLWNWSIDGFVVGADTIYKNVITTPGIHNVRLIGTSLAGCQDSAKGVFQVYYRPKPTLTLDPTALPNDSIQCQLGNLYTYSMSYGIDAMDTLKDTKLSYGDGKFEMPVVTNTHTYDTTGVYPVKLWVSNFHDCADSISVPYRVVGNPTADFNYSGVCVPDSVFFIDTLSKSVNPIVKRYWDFGNGQTDSMITQKNVFFSNAGPYSATLLVFNANPLGGPGDFKACWDTAVRAITTLINRPVINWSISGSMPLCKGDSAIFTITGGDSVSWLNDLDTNSVRALNKSGNYKFVVYNGGVCYAMDSVQVYAYPPANIVAHNDTAVYRGRKAQVYVSNALLNFHWFPGYYLEDSTKVKVNTINLIDSVTLFVTATDSNGCTDLDSVHIRVLTPPLVKIPNLITPNKDKENEFWDLIEIPDIFLFDIVISDRQGRRVYTSNDYKNNWNAVDSDGKELPTGVYFYYMKNRQTSEEYRGYIQVIR